MTDTKGTPPKFVTNTLLYSILVSVTNPLVDCQDIQEHILLETFQIPFFDPFVHIITSCMDWKEQNLLKLFSELHFWKCSFWYDTERYASVFIAMFYIEKKKRQRSCVLMPEIHLKPFPALIRDSVSDIYYFHTEFVSGFF